MTTLKKEVLSKYLNPYFFETGTSGGAGVQLALEFDFEKIYSIEINEKLQTENINKFKQQIEENRLNLITGDSLTELIKTIPILDKRTTFWLDAHVDEGPCGIKKCPLYEELSAIKNSVIKNHTILIDDLRILGGHWGEGISLQTIIDLIKDINPNYSFKTEDGFVPNDILVAYIE